MDTNRFIGDIVNGQQIARIYVIDNQPAPIGYLAPITKGSLGDSQLIERLAAWRNRTSKYFFTQSIVTCERTKDWLENVVLNDYTRLLFIIYSKATPVGTLGFQTFADRSAELGNLLRGEMGGHPRLMYYAEVAVVEWIFSVLDVDLIYGFTLSDNLMALNLHKCVGFKLTQLIPLHKTENEGEICLRRGEPGAESPDGLYAQKVELQRSEFVWRKEQNSRIFRASGF